MEKTDVINRLTPVFRKVFSNETLSLSEKLTANDVTGWDSLSHMILLTEIEEAFKIKFRLKELSKMKNVGDMIEIILLKI